MDIGDIRPREVIDIQDDKNQVLSNSNVQASGSRNQSQASACDDKVQDQQQVASSSSQPSDQSNASNQVQVLQPTNVARDCPLDFIIGDISRGMQTRSRLTSFCEHFSFMSSIKPKKIDKALKDVDWMNAMHEELNNFKRN
jgi:Flp pilus assembly protein TadG